jgi:DNA-binding transcriptional LysR family regulator
MQYVLAVAKYRNFTLAAESCYISQSSLSQQISNLEKELGVRLFNRTTRNIQITEAGQAFLEQATNILRDIDLLGQSMSTYAGCLRGTINIGAITALERIHFSDLIADFYSCYPNLTLNIYQGKSISLLESLEKRTIDVAFVAQPPAREYPHIKFQKMGIDEYVLLLAENHPLASRETVDLSELKDERFIMHHPDQTVSGLCLQACNEAGFTPHVTCRIGSSAIALSLIRAGLGIGFLPAEELEYYRMQGIRQLRLVKPFEKRIVMATLAKGTPSQLVSIFLQFVEDRIRTHSIL